MSLGTDDQEPPRTCPDAGVGHATQALPVVKRSIVGPMSRMVVSRLALGLLTMGLMSGLIFLSAQMLPGDPARAILGRNATPQSVAALRLRLGLDDSAFARYLRWVTDIAHGDLGTSMAAGKPVTEMLAGRVENSMALVVVAAMLSIPLALLLGVLTGARKNSLFDHATSSVLVVLASLPEFVVGVGLILIFSTGLFHLLPPVSQLDLNRSVWSQLDLLIFPAIVLAVAIVPYVARMLRASVIEVLESDYVRMARMKGLKEATILVRHVLPNALAPTIQTVALSLAWLAGGIVIVEYLFNYAGIGAILVDSVESRDLPMVQAIVLLITGIYVLTNLLADIVTILVSPRVRTALG